MNKLLDLLGELLFLERCRICHAGCAFAGRQARTAVRPKTVCRDCWRQLTAERKVADWCELDVCGAFKIASGSYYTGHLKKLIYHLKYDGDRLLAADLAMLATAAWGELSEQVSGMPALLVPVPLHKERMRTRGYNQSELLARSMGAALGLTVCPRALHRVKPTVAQHGLGRHERQSNLKGAFACRPELVAGKAVVLVDDVFTSGATLREAARTVMAAGAARVAGLTVARAVLTGHSEPVDQVRLGAPASRRH